MLKLWKKRAFLLILLTLLISLISFNSVSAQEITSPNTTNFSSPNIENINPSVRTQTAEDNSEVAPSNENQLTPNETSSRVNQNRPEDPYAKYFDAIKKFNEKLYGENG